MIAERPIKPKIGSVQIPDTIGMDKLPISKVKALRLEEIAFNKIPVAIK